MTLIAMDNSGEKWAAFHGHGSNSNRAGGGGGWKELSGTLDRLRITINGSTVFNDGSVNILMEG